LCVHLLSVHFCIYVICVCVCVVLSVHMYTCVYACGLQC